MLKLSKQIKSIILASSLLGGLTIHPHIGYAFSKDTASGHYLAARHAQFVKDWDNASSFLTQVSKKSSLPQRNLDTHFLLSIGSGNIDLTKNIIRDKLPISDDINPLSKTIQAIDLIEKNDLKNALGILNELPDKNINLYVKSILSAWIYAELGEYEHALKSIHNLPRQDTSFSNPLANITEALISEYMYHKGFLNEDAPYQAYKKASTNMMTLQSALSIANFYERHHQQEDAQNIYKQLIEIKPLFDGAYQGLKRLEQDVENSFNIKNIQDGIAISLFDLASFLYEQKGYESALIYARLSEYLSPQHPETRLMLGDIMNHYGTYDQAINHYRQIKPNSINFSIAQSKLAEAHEKNNDPETAKRILLELLSRWNNNKDILIHLGDIERRQGNFTHAISYYNKALIQKNELKHEDWSILYARAISHDENDDWNSAETDLLHALEINPDHPLILNYLGYSWADRGLHLDKAFDMVEKAMLLKPGNGYILDSFGWVLHKMGHHNHAIQILERAIALIPYDPTLNDHLGDVYWRAGRKNEARFQWEKSIKFSKNNQKISTLHDKIRYGLLEDQTRLKSTAQGSDQ